MCVTLTLRHKVKRDSGVTLIQAQRKGFAIVRKAGDILRPLLTRWNAKK
jgi:hypothetical protein